MSDDDGSPISCWHSMCVWYYKKNKTQAQKVQNSEKVSMQKCSNIQGFYQNSVVEHPSQQQIQIEVNQEDLLNSSKVKKWYEYPKNKLIFLKKSKAHLIVKITEKEFKFQTKTNEQTNIIPNISTNCINEYSPLSIIQPTDIFQLYEQGISFTDEGLKQATPELIAKYIATRIENQFLIIDLGCGIGGNLIQFAHQCGFVIGVEIQDESIKNANKNCIHYKIQHKVDLINANFLQLRKLQGDVAFIHPTISQERVQFIDIFRDLYPNIYTLVEAALNIARNIIILFPKGIDITNLVTLFDVLKNQFKYYPFHLAIEIEMIIVNKQLQYYVIYVGEIAAISESEIYHFLSKNLMETGNEINGVDFSNSIYGILEEIQANSGWYHLNELINKTIKNQKKNQSKLQQFILEACQQKYLDQQLIANLLNAVNIYPEDAQSFTFMQSELPHQLILIPKSQDSDKIDKKATSMDEPIISISDYSLKSDRQQSLCIIIQLLRFQVNNQLCDDDDEELNRNQSGLVIDFQLNSLKDK